MNKLIFIPIVAFIFIVIDIYVFQAVQTAFQGISPIRKKILDYIFWGITLVSVTTLFCAAFLHPDILGDKLRSFLITGIFINYFSKIFVVFFLLIDDLIRLGQWGYDQLTHLFKQGEVPEIQGGIARSEFLSRAGLVVASVPVLGMTYGIISGAHDYQVRRHIVKLPKLPKAFHGIKIGQLSDIHAGSFFNKTAVQGGVDMLLKEKADIIFFTGDLVNNRAKEMKDYVAVFSRVTAPLGVFSTLGNHDYGNYAAWPSKEEKLKNLEELKNIHRAMGWKLLMNQHELLEQSGEQLAILGVENWSAKSRFPKYGKLHEAHRGIEGTPVKLLLSHDPSHWDAQVRPDYPDIDITFAGHTHGMQFGVKLGNFQWSPVQYMYDQWAGLYQSGNQYLYVNTGFGYIGFPGRIGMPPEITIIELQTV